MSKWTKPRRDPGRTYIDEEKKKRSDRILRQVAWFMENAVPEDEPVFVAALKDANPKVSTGDLKDAIRLFRAAIYARQLPGSGGH